MWSFLLLVKSPPTCVVKRLHSDKIQGKRLPEAGMFPAPPVSPTALEALSSHSYETVIYQIRTADYLPARFSE